MRLDCFFKLINYHIYYHVDSFRFDKFEATLMLDNKPILMNLGDVSGHENYEILRPLSYVGTVSN